MFLTVGVPRASAAAFEQALLRKVRLSREVNPGIARLFPATDVLFLATYGGCSCGLWAVERPAPIEDPRRSRFERKGYSPARIARILAEPLPARSPPAHIEAFRAALAPFAPVRLCLRQVRGDPRTEPVGPDVTVLSV